MLNRAAGYFRGKGKQTSSIANKADVNDCGDKYKTPIARAVYNGDIETAEIIIRAGANIYNMTESAENPLMIAAEKGHVKMVEFLITKHARINATDLRGMTPLMFAAYEGHTAIVKILIDAGANTSYFMHNGSTALSLAIAKDHTAVVELLQAEAAGEVRPIFHWKTTNNPDHGITVSNIPNKELIYIKEDDIMSYIDSEHNKTRYIWIYGFTYNDLGSLVGSPTAINYYLYSYDETLRTGKWDISKPFRMKPEDFNKLNLEQTTLTAYGVEKKAMLAARDGNANGTNNRDDPMSLVQTIKQEKKDREDRKDREDIEFDLEGEIDQHWELVGTEPTGEMIQGWRSQLAKRYADTRAAKTSATGGKKKTRKTKKSRKQTKKRVKKGKGKGKKTKGRK